LALAGATAGALTLLAVGRVAARRRRRPATGVVAPGRLERAARVSGLGLSLGARSGLDRARVALAPPERRAEVAAEAARRHAEQVAQALGGMKGALMKIGQLASFVDDGMPEPVRQALSTLQAEAPPMPPEVAAGVVTAELGVPPEECFARFEPTPLAAASIGQVHRAVTRDGREVAVKIQYPGVDRAIAADLANLDLLALLAPLSYRGLDVQAMTEEIRTRVTEELDYRLEAEHQRRFAAFYAGHPFIHVPAVVDELSGARVLTTELAPGVPFAQMETWDQADRDRAAEILYRFTFGSIYRMSAFNGDPHPGNYRFSPGGPVHFLDFGLVKHFTPSDIDGLLLLVESAVRDPRPGSVRRACEAIGFLVPGGPVPEGAAEDFTSLFFDLVAEPGDKTVTAEWATEVARRFLTARTSHAEVATWGNVPAPYVILQRINLGLMSILGRLEATADWRGISEEIWPDVAGPPVTDLGRAEAEWLARAHPDLVGPRRSRPRLPDGPAQRG
jgi:hypothetical protein